MLIAIQPLSKMNADRSAALLEKAREMTKRMGDNTLMKGKVYSRGPTVLVPRAAKQ